MKRKDEEFCKLRFHQYILGMYPAETIRWEDVPSKEEPPDFYLYLNGIKYAVEVTDMIEKIDVGTARTIPRNIVNLTYVNFVKKIEKEARENGWLSGTYTILFHRVIKNFGAIEDEIREQLLYYIQNTKELESAQALEFFRGYGRVCSINKSNNTKNIIYPGLPASSKWEGQSTKDSQILLEERLKDKVLKLRDLSMQVILLIYDTNGYFPNNKAFLEAVPQLSETSRFHTVFIVSSNFGDFLLCSKIGEWK